MVSRSAVPFPNALAIEDRGKGSVEGARNVRCSTNRAKRVLALLAGVVTVGLLDLYLTTREASQSFFEEANPIAAPVLDGSVLAPGLFKCATLGAGMVILLMLRRRRSAEIGCWILLLAHVGLLLRWGQYYAVLSEIDPTVQFDRWGGATAPAAVPSCRAAEEARNPSGEVGLRAEAGDRVCPAQDEALRRRAPGAAMLDERG
jgi:hypothetical protein